MSLEGPGLLPLAIESNTPKCRQQPDELWPSACAWRGGQSAIADRDLEDVVSTSRRLGGLAPGQSRAARSLRDHVF